MPTKTVNSVTATLPNSVEAEQNVLCCIMRNQDIQLEIIAQLDESDFYQQNHAIIFAAMQQISVQSHKVGDADQIDTVNFATVIDCLRRNGKLSQVGDIDYIMRLNDLLPGTSNYDEYVAIVKRCSTMRKLIDICGKVTQKAYSSASAEEAITYAEESIFQLSQGGSNGGLVNLAQDVARTMLKINERFVNPDAFKGIQTGFRQFDYMTNGLHPGELIVLAARPGVGKSALAMNIVENVAKQGHTVAVFSLEMSNEQLLERMLSAMSTVPLQFIKNGHLPAGEQDLAKLRRAQEVICSNMNLYGNDYPNVKPSEISSQCRRLKAQHGLDLVVIDYIQLMSGGTDPKQGRQAEVAAITRALKLMAKELKVPVIALSQLKRDVDARNAQKGKEGGSGEPVLSDLRESGAIEQDADIVLFIHKEKDENGSVKHSLIVAKHRNGETGNIPLVWLGKYVRFADQDFVAQLNADSDQAQQQSPSISVDNIPELMSDATGEETEFVVDDIEDDFVDAPDTINDDF